LLSDGQYVLRDGAKNMSAKDKSTYILVPKRDDEQLSDKSVTLAPATGTEVLEEESGMAEKLNNRAHINHLTF
jgi:regulator of nonsense transcripts 3